MQISRTGRTCRRERLWKRQSTVLAGTEILLWLTEFHMSLDSKGLRKFLLYLSTKRHPANSSIC